jgi:surface protein
MFYDCSLLESLIINNFDTSKIINMHGMFFNCSSLQILNISNFDTSQVTSMAYMFEACSSLISLNLASFETSKVEKMDNIFANCPKLAYIDLENANIKSFISAKNIFLNISNSLVICSNYDDWNNLLNGYEISINCDSISNENILYQCYKKKSIEIKNTDYLCNKCSENYFQTK